MASKGARHQEEKPTPDQGPGSAGGDAPDGGETNPLAASQERVAGPLDVRVHSRRIQPRFGANSDVGRAS